MRGAAALNLVPDLQARAREGRARPAISLANRHHAHATNVQDDLLARQFGLEVKQFCRGRMLVIWLGCGAAQLSHGGNG